MNAVFNIIKVGLHLKSTSLKIAVTKVFSRLCNYNDDVSGFTHRQHVLALNMYEHHVQKNHLGAFQIWNVQPLYINTALNQVNEKCTVDKLEITDSVSCW